MVRLVFALFCGLLGATGATGFAAEAEKPIRVLFTYGGHGFQEKELYSMLDALPGIKYDKAQIGRATCRERV